MTISRVDALNNFEQVMKAAPVAPKKPFISNLSDVTPASLRKSADLLEAYEKADGEYKLFRVTHATRVNEARQLIESALVAEYPGFPKEAILHIWNIAFREKESDYSEAFEYYDDLLSLAITFRRMTQQQ